MQNSVRNSVKVMIGAAVAAIFALVIWWQSQPVPVPDKIVEKVVEQVSEAPTPQPEPATVQEPAPALPPEFDVVRMTPDGQTVIAGQAAPGETVEILIDGEVISTVEADATGAFATVLSIPPADQPRELALRTSLGDVQGATMTLTAAVDTDAGESAAEVASAGQTATSATEETAAAIAAAEAAANEASEVAAAEAAAATEAAAAATAALKAAEAAAAEAAMAANQEAEAEAAATAAAEIAATAEATADQAAIAEATAGEEIAADEAAIKAADAAAAAIAADIAAAQTAAAEVAAAQAAAAASAQVAAAETAARIAADAAAAAISAEIIATDITAGSVEPNVSRYALSAPVIILPQEGAEQAPILVKPEPEGLVLLQPALTESPTSITLERITYSEEGDMLASGRGRPGSIVRIYANAEFVDEAICDEAGEWQVVIAAEVAAKTQLLRFDEIDDSGNVISRLETPFEYSPQVIMQELRARKIVVQKGDHLWKFAEQYYGEGIRYSLIFGANSTFIRDPDLIYPGQIFTIPELIDSQ